MGIWNRLSNKIVSGWDPAESLQKSDAIDRIFWIHFIPTDNDVTRESYSIRYSLYLGTIAAVIFTILCATGLLQMLRYVPSVERAYWSVKDLQFIFPFGGFIRDLHRISAYLMIVFVVLHLCRIFYTGAFKKGRRKRTNGWINWMTGIMLLGLTLAMAFTGYVLPWDQVGYWGATIGTNIIKSIPVIGDWLRYSVLGGNELGQNFLIRIYAFHVLLLPLLTVLFISYHFWRNRRDGGMACEDNMEVGDAKGTEGGQAFSGLEKDEALNRTPMFLKRLIWVSLGTTAFTILLALFVSIPLNAPANPVMAENPAKAPWFLLWLQELVASTTISVGQYRINGGFVGGVVIPGLLLTWLALVPFFDNSPPAATGVWFHRSRLRQNIMFTIILLAIICLIFFTYFCRGPNWVFFWPWEVWPEVH
ncbi:MAG: cytochrome bc complex cytochrome b subunit [Desulfobacteraceae bacterium]|nr:MAG: cytochrome bc complex cytochrome b subunit [Desulfobacteraceae bacterium]